MEKAPVPSNNFLSSSQPLETENTSNRRTFVLNPIPIIIIFILLLSLSTWSVITSIALLKNQEIEYPKAIIAIPLLIILCLPPIVSLLVILFRSFYTASTSEHDSLEPLDLIHNEEQRQLFLLPLAVSGTVMSILPAYYFRFKKYYFLLGCQGVLGMTLLLLFLGVALIPEKDTGTRRHLFITIYEK